MPHDKKETFLSIVKWKLYPLSNAPHAQDWFCYLFLIPNTISSNFIPHFSLDVSCILYDSMSIHYMYINAFLLLSISNRFISVRLRNVYFNKPIHSITLTRKKTSFNMFGHYQMSKKMLYMYTSVKLKKKYCMKSNPNHIHTHTHCRSLNLLFTPFFRFQLRTFLLSFTLLLSIIGHVHKIENFDFGRVCIQYIVMMVCLDKTFMKWKILERQQFFLFYFYLAPTNKNTQHNFSCWNRFRMA